MSLGGKKKDPRGNYYWEKPNPLGYCAGRFSANGKARFLHRNNWGILLLKAVVHARILGSVTSIFIMISVKGCCWSRDRGRGHTPSFGQLFQFHLVSVENWSNKRNRGSVTANDPISTSVFVFNTNCSDDNLPIQFLSKTSPYHHLPSHPLCLQKLMRSYDLNSGLHDATTCKITF